MRSRREPRAALGALLVLLAGAPLLASAHPMGALPAPCPGFADVPGQGPSCPVEGGWLVLLPDGSAVPTHGPDAPLAASAGPQEPSRLPPVRPFPPACAADPATDPHFEIVYARPFDALDGHAVWVPRIREAVNESNGLLRAEALAFNRSASYRVRCEDGLPAVSRAVLPTRSDADTFATIVADLKALGYDRANVKYWVFHDGSVGEGVAGQATMHPDDRLSPDNRNMEGPGYAVTFGGFSNATTRLVMMHESAHTLGAVPPGAPHGRRATAPDVTEGHCDEGVDVMCPSTPLHAVSVSVRSNGTCVYCHGVAGRSLDARCPGQPRFDCGNDDYFHPDPPEHSWLATRWNLGHPYNRFFDFGNRAPLVTGVACEPNPAMPGMLVTCVFAAEDETQVTFEIDWGDGRRDALAPPPGEPLAAAQAWSALGTHRVVATATDGALRSAPMGADVHVVPCVLSRSGRLTLGMLDAQDEARGAGRAGAAAENASVAIERGIPAACGGAPYTISESLLTKFLVEWRDASGRALPEPRAGVVPHGADHARVVLYFGADAVYRLEAVS